MKYKYRVYDTQEEKWFPGEYETQELKQVLGFTADWMKYVKQKCLLKKRYRLEVTNGDSDMYVAKRIPPELLTEWDRVRLKIMGVKK